MKIHGTGCSLVDNLYSPVDFNSTSYQKWLAGAGRSVGLTTGGLVFGDDLEKASGQSYSAIIREIAGNIRPEQNIGGPSIVALIHMSQILENPDIEIAYFGARSDDDIGKYIKDKLAKFDINTDGYIITDGNSPFTDVLSDPSFNANNGERSFINYIGAAGKMTEKDFPASFFDADILIFGGTGLTPGIHDDLTGLLRRGKAAGCLNFVNTVYDFRNQNKNPNKPWPLVENPEDFGLIDILITDNEEALKISGKPDKTKAAEFFLETGVKSGIITHGCEDIICFSDGTFFSEKDILTMPVSEKAGEMMRATSPNEADTTGCGDNFAGGVYASTAEQLISAPGEQPSLRKAAILGVVSGGLAGLYLGGVFYEKHPGEKLEKLRPLLKAYSGQTGGKF